MFKIIRKSALAWLIILLFIFNSASSQVVINEICPSNAATISNSSGDFEDWIELYNSGSSTVNLEGYRLTDEINEPDVFIFPSVALPVGQRIIVFAAETHIPVNHYEMAVDGSSVFSYIPGSSTLDTNWRNLSFNDQSWNSGNGGIGFNDGDDATEIANTGTLLMRRTFSINDTSAILNAIFMMDYDDGFVAYLNGVEIAHANMPVYDGRPAWNALALVTHEAQMSLGLKPDSFFIGESKLKSIIRQGTNVLSVETHDYSANPTDMSSKPFLFFGMKGSAVVFPLPPLWFVSVTEYFSADFHLNSSGETVFLLNPSGAVVDQIAFPQISKDQTYGRIPDGSPNWCYINSPSPEMTNNTSVCYSGYAETPSFFPDGGFFSSPQSVTISATSGSLIRYTVNGDEPTVNSPLYTFPLTIASTQTLRVRVFRSGFLPGPVVTKTFFINENSHLPVITLTTDSLNLWDYNMGIYVMGPNADSIFPFFGANFWQDWNRPASVEYFDKAKQKKLSFDADIQIYGNYSRYKPQKSFEIKLHEYYGLGEVDYPLISDKPYIDKYDRIILRNSGTDWNEVHFRDALMQRLMKKTNIGYVGAEPVRVYLNGEHWGVYLLSEKHNQNWIYSNYGIDEKDVNYLEEIGGDIVTGIGSDESYWEMYNYITTQNAVGNEYYNEADRKLDLKNFTDYIIAETYYNNGDWIGEWTNNIKLWRGSGESDKWRYIMIDTDYGFGLKGDLTDNRLSMARNPIAFSHTSELFDALLNNQTFKQKFINRYADLINTIYLPTNVDNVMRQFRDSMVFDMIEHFQKWGGDTNTWNNRIADMMDFVSQRPQIMRNYIQTEFNLTNQVLLSLDVSPPGAGRIEISTVVPELPWSGVYFHGNPVTITAIPNPGYSFDHWNSDVAITIADFNKRTTYDFSSDDHIIAYFTGSAATPMLTVSEFNYHSSPEYKVDDWIELHNYGNFDLDISGWSISDGEDHTKFEFPVTTVIPAGGYLVLPEDSIQFKSLFPKVDNRLGQLDFNLSNSDDHVYIFDYKGLQILSFEYEDHQPWPIEADGLGYTCELVDPAVDLNDGHNWYAGCFGGSPGRAYSNELSTLIDIKGLNFFCSGSETSLSIIPVSDYQYQWKFQGSEIAGANLDSLNVSQPGEYNLQVSCNGCLATSPGLNVIEKSLSIINSVTNGVRCNAGAMLLSANSQDTIYWYDSPGGKEIGKGKSFMTAFISQTTTVYARAGKICPGDEVAVAAQITNEKCDQMSVFPNPSASGPIAIHDDEFNAGLTTLLITDMHGSVVFRDDVEINAAGNSEMISFAFDNGIYNFTAYQNDKVFNTKFLMLK